MLQTHTERFSVRIDLPLYSPDVLFPVRPKRKTLRLIGLGPSTATRASRFCPGFQLQVGAHGLPRTEIERG
jgi:hypothetical protein